MSDTFFFAIKKYQVSNILICWRQNAKAFTDSPSWRTLMSKERKSNKEAKKPKKDPKDKKEKKDPNK